MLILLSIFISQVLCQLCQQPIKYDQYQFSINQVSDQQWNYDNIQQSKTSNLKDIESSIIQLLDLQIILDIHENLTITRNRTGGPTIQYKTDRSQGINNYVSYQSEFFQFTFAEHSFDFQSQISSYGELINQLCDVEPIYSVIQFPIYKLYEQQPLKFNGQFNMNTDTISDFNFKQNILGTIKSDISSYVTYKAPINIPPCSIAYCYLSTNPLFFIQDQLDGLLQKNQQNIMRRVQIDNTVIQYNKRKILFYGDIEFADYNDTVEWAVTWVASIIPCLIFAIVVCVYGQYEISNIGRYKRLEMKHGEAEIEMLNQEDKQFQ